MKILHTADWHLGKRMNGFSLWEDQSFIVNQVIGIAQREGVRAVIIAGDVYDRSLPPVEAVRLLDEALTRLAALGIEVFLVSGNHDSADRVGFASGILAGQGVHISPAYDGARPPCLLADEFGEVAFYLLPFLKPASVRHAYPDAAIESYDQAVALALSKLEVDRARRNVLIAHQFVVGSTRCESEEASVGGVDGVSAEHFAPFDYTALGHLHSPQGESVRYSGSPLKYSLSEVGQSKSVTLIELRAKGEMTIEPIPLVPMRDVRRVSGTYMELTDRSTYRGQPTEDYIFITLTDEEEIPEGLARLRSIYPNALALTYDNRRTRSEGMGEAAALSETRSPIELFEALYQGQNGAALSDEQRAWAQALVQEIWEEGEGQ